jgi:hypothetical protein
MPNKGPVIVVVPGSGGAGPRVGGVGGFPVVSGPVYSEPRYLPGSVAKPAAVRKDEPVCVDGTWAIQDSEKKYVCLSWFYRGHLYTPVQLQQLLSQQRTQ